MYLSAAVVRTCGSVQVCYVYDMKGGYLEEWCVHPSLFYIQLCNAHFDDMAQFCVVEIINGAVKSVLEKGRSSLSMA